MRSQSPDYRGWIGLIRKGSGQVSGIARLADVGLPLSLEEMLANIEKHRIPEAMILSGEVAKWNIPWKLADVRVLKEPVPYRHPNGAITLFNLDAQVGDEILDQLKSHQRHRQLGREDGGPTKATPSPKQGPLSFQAEQDCSPDARKIDRRVDFN